MPPRTVAAPFAAPRSCVSRFKQHPSRRLRSTTRRGEPKRSSQSIHSSSRRCRLRLVEGSYPTASCIEGSSHSCWQDSSVSRRTIRRRRFDELVAALARDLERGWLPSYKNETYPCDHAPAASALRLHSLLRGSSPDAADRLTERLRRSLANRFPTSLVDRTERATTLAFAAAFLLPGEPELAARFADRFVTFCDRGIVAACREWRTPHRADAASGPIVAGYSVGATALPATRMLPGWHDALELTALAAGASSLDEAHPLEAALFRFGQTARTWH